MKEEIKMQEISFMVIDSNILCLSYRTNDLRCW